MYFMLILFASIGKGATIKCYECTAPDQPSCIATQKEIACAKGTCMTLSYSQMEDGYTTKQYVKRCSKTHDACQKFCQKRIPFYIKDCQVLDCCGTDLCNKKYMKKTLITKRSNERSNGNCLVNKKIILTLLTFAALLSFEVLV